MAASREEKLELKQERKKRKTNLFYLFPFFALIAVLLLLFIQTRKPQTFTIMETYSYIHQEIGDGLTVFNEYAPNFLKGLNTESLGMREGQRMRVDDYISNLDDDMFLNIQEDLSVYRSKLQELDNSPLELEELDFRIDYLEKVLDKGQVLVPKSSIVSFTLDGYEELYSPLYLDSIQPGDLHVNDLASSPLSGIKFIDNRIYYVMVDLPQSVEIREWSLGSEYELIYDGESSIRAILNQVKTDDLNRQLLLFTARDDIFKVLDKRFGKISIASQPIESYLLPTSAIYEEGGIYYCHRVNENNVIEKVEISLVDSFIESKEFVVQATVNEEGIESIKLYDRIIVDPSASQIGEIY